MRHNNKGFKLGRTASHRKATLAALSTALIKHKRIRTTLTKAKALRMYVEPLINRAKDPSTHNHRQVFRYLQDKEAVKELFTEVSGKIGDRPGGYTRIVKLGRRAGDGTEMAVIELVDYNDVKAGGTTATRTRRTRRTRRGGGGGSQRAETTTTTTSQSPSKSKGVDTAAVEEPVADEQATPVAERTEPQAEAQAVADAQATEAPEQPEAAEDGEADEAKEQ